MISDRELKSLIASTIECTICGEQDKLVVDHDQYNK
jgi:hypothetical protein